MRHFASRLSDPKVTDLRRKGAAAVATAPRAAAASAPRTAVVGAGIAGLTAALTLHDAGYACTVYAEIGGELIDTNHKKVLEQERRVLPGHLGRLDGQGTAVRPGAHGGRSHRGGAGRQGGDRRAGLGRDRRGSGGPWI
jgi:glycine/D-amino acid oxidase-like deaminating enzyme